VVPHSGNAESTSSDPLGHPGLVFFYNPFILNIDVFGDFFTFSRSSKLWNTTAPKAVLELCQVIRELSTKLLRPLNINNEMEGKAR
jgi:hypothetical protein